MSIEIGKTAPDFTLVDTDKEMVSLSAQKGSPVVLLFFPMAFTGVCTEELCSIRDGLGEYQNLNAKVYGISVDSPFTLAKFKEDLNLNFPLLSDFNKEASNAYDSIHEEFAFGMKGVSKRSAFVIDAEGIVQYAEVLPVPTELPNFDAVRDCLSKLS